MWRQAEDLLHEAERIRWSFLQTAVSARSAPLLASASWGPAVNIVETPERFWIMVELPGIDPDEIQIALLDGWITLSGRRTLPAELREGQVHLLEIPGGPFERRIRMPPGAKVEPGARSLREGILLIEMRKVL